MDYAGPLLVKAAPGRGYKTKKSYIAVFVCFATRAIHLELVKDYSSAAFLAAIKCFVARRGLPAEIHSDQGTTFQGARIELQAVVRANLSNPDLQNTFATQGIKWSFIPPSAPHQGDLWEAGVRAVKHHLKRIVGSCKLSSVEMRTLLCQIEACLNPRPLTPLRDDASEDLALTPGHFLVHTSLKAVPQSSLLDYREHLLTRWQKVQKMVQDFWTRWQRENLLTLQQRNEWQEKTPNLQVDDVVLLTDPNHAPCDWALARVVEVIPSKDGRIRQALVKTASSQLVRPITRLCKLLKEEE